MKVAQVYLLSREPRFQPFTYYLPLDFNVSPGTMVVVPFKKGLEAGIISAISDANDINGLLPALGTIAPRGGLNQDFGKLLLALSELLLCSPAELFQHVAFGNPEKRISLFFFAVLKP